MAEVTVQDVVAVAADQRIIAVATVQNVVVVAAAERVGVTHARVSTTASDFRSQTSRPASARDFTAGIAGRGRIMDRRIQWLRGASRL